MASYPADPNLSRRRAVLLADGVAVFITGILAIALNNPLSRWMGWPSSGTLIGLGLLFLIWGGALTAVAQRSRPTRGFTLAVALVNNLWFDATILLIALLRPPLTGIGLLVAVGSGAVAMLFSVLQVMSTRQR